MSTLNIRPLNPELKLIASKELHENPDQIEENLVILKQWIEKSTHLKARIDDQFLIAFLRGCKYSLEITKQKIDMFYTYRTHLPEIAHNLDPLGDKVKELIKLGILFPLPIAGNSGSPRVIFYQIKVYDPRQVRAEDIIKMVMMTGDVLLNEDDNSSVSGQICVLDLADISMGHVTQMTPSFVKKTVMLWQDSSPIRQKGVHYINAPKIFEQFFVLLKSFLKEKMQKRLFIHSSLDSLYSMVPREMLPTEYGGEAGPVKNLRDDWAEKLLSYRDYFLDDDLKYGVDEKKRIGVSTNPLLGIDGTFKQLQID